MMSWLASLCAGLAVLSGFGLFTPPDMAQAQNFGLLTFVLLLIAHLRPLQYNVQKILFGVVHSLWQTVVVLAAQLLVFLVYERLAVGAPASPALAWVAEQFLPLLGMQGKADAGHLLVQTGRHVFDVAVGPEKMGLPLVAMWIGGGLLLQSQCLSGRRYWLATAKIVAVCLVYVFVRLLVLIALMHEYDALNVFWSTHWLLLEFVPLALLLGALFPINFKAQKPPVVAAAVPVAMVTVVGAIAACLIVVVASIRPVASDQETRVLIDDAHSDWAWTDVAFTKEALNRQATYSYSNMVEYLRHFYQVDINRDGDISDQMLSEIDVLMLKTPTRAFTTDEVDAVERFTRGGGGLMLIGDHTNLFGMTTNLNPVADRFGMRFVEDDTFTLGTGATTIHRNKIQSTHPIALHLDNFEFETSCTIEAGPRAENVMIGYGLGREYADYGHINFFGNMTANLEDGYGAFRQAITVEFGRGRVFAFSDSTVLSNFSVFKPGRAELAMAAIEYVRAGARAWWLQATSVVLAGLVLIIIVVVRLKTKFVVSPGALVVGAAVGTLTAFALVTQIHSKTHVLPVPKRPLNTVTFDRSLSNFKLSSLVEVVANAPKEDFSAFFVNSQRLTLIPRVKTDLVSALAEGDPIVFINPLGGVRQSQANAVASYLEKGGRLLLLVGSDGPFYTVNALLSGVGISVSADLGLAGTRPPVPPPVQAVEVVPESNLDAGEQGAGEPGVGDQGVGGQSASEQAGGEQGPGELFALAPARAMVAGAQRLAIPSALGIEVDKQPVIYSREIGAGRIIVLVGSEYFSRDKMGPAYNAPDDDEERLYRLQYYMMEQLWLPSTEAPINTTGPEDQKSSDERPT